MELLTKSHLIIRPFWVAAHAHAGTDETVPLLHAARARTHTGHQMSQGRNKQMAWPGLESRTSRILCEHSDHWATEPHGRPVTIPPCFIRFVPESARNHVGTDETAPSLLSARARTSHIGHQMSQGRKEHMAQPRLEPRTSRIPREHSDHWATEPQSRPVIHAFSKLTPLMPLFS